MVHNIMQQRQRQQWSLLKATPIMERSAVYNMVLERTVLWQHMARRGRVTALCVRAAPVRAARGRSTPRSAPFETSSHE
jgi:hypothetical protein